MATQTHQERSKERMSERAALLKENESIWKRQAEMKHEAAEVRAEVDRLQQFVTDALIAGKDSTKEQDQLQRAQVKLATYEKAMQQSEDQIKANNLKAEEKEKHARLADFEGDQDLAAPQLVKAYNAGKAYLSAIAECAPIFASLRSHGIEISSYEESKTLDRFYSLLREGLEDSNGLPARLKTIETNFRAVFEKARNK